MSSTSAAATIFAAPAESLPKVGELLEEAGLDAIDWCEAADLTSIELGATYTSHAASADVAETLAPKLAELGATFDITADATDEFDGTVAMGSPEHGVFISPCDSNGNVALSDTVIDAIVAEHGNDLAALVAALDAATGKTIRTHINGFYAEARS